MISCGRPSEESDCEARILKRARASCADLAEIEAASADPTRQYHHCTVCNALCRLCIASYGALVRTQMRQHTRRAKHNRLTTLSHLLFYLPCSLATSAHLKHRGTPHRHSLVHYPLQNSIHLFLHLLWTHAKIILGPGQLEFVQ